MRRIGFVASEITKNRGVAICAPIAPYQRTRGETLFMDSFSSMNGKWNW